MERSIPVELVRRPPRLNITCALHLNHEGNGPAQSISTKQAAPKKNPSSAAASASGPNVVSAVFAVTKEGLGFEDKCCASGLSHVSRAKSKGIVVIHNARVVRLGYGYML
jgi:hypothetical protein